MDEFNIESAVDCKTDKTVLRNSARTIYLDNNCYGASCSVDTTCSVDSCSNNSTHAMTARSARARSILQVKEEIARRGSAGPLEAEEEEDTNPRIERCLYNQQGIVETVQTGKDELKVSKPIDARRQY